MNNPRASTEEYFAYSNLFHNVFRTGLILSRYLRDKIIHNTVFSKTKEPRHAFRYSNSAPTVLWMAYWLDFEI